MKELRVRTCLLALMMPLAALLAVPAEATQVVVAGVFPGMAVLVIDAQAPRTFAVGAQSPEGIKLLSVDTEGAMLEVDGRRQRAEIGSVNALAQSRGAPVIQIQADGAGHFYVSGAVNGASMRFLVDTGASLISIGRSDALRAGIDYLKGRPSTSMTANGTVQVWLVKLDSVKIGEVLLHNVEASIHAQDMPVALLGMSFLNRMEMRRDNGMMNLRQRY